jgi:hypothetical protein
MKPDEEEQLFPCTLAPPHPGPLPHFAAEREKLRQRWARRLHSAVRTGRSVVECVRLSRYLRTRKRQRADAVQKAGALRQPISNPGHQNPSEVVWKLICSLREFYAKGNRD